MTDKRNAVRWKTVLPVRYLAMSDHAEGSARTQDLSTLGVRLAMVEKRRPKDRLELMLEIPGNSGPVCIEAEVVWQQASCGLEQECNYLTGMEFIKIRECFKKDIVDYINANFFEQFKERWWQGV